MKFVAVHYENGVISKVKNSLGQTLDYNQALRFVENGSVENMTIGTNIYGEPRFHTKPDGEPHNNLSNLPRF